jgi:acetyl-CoA C-acetyltransferase
LQTLDYQMSRSPSLPDRPRLDLDPERINRWGGAIAIGHPIGMSGTRILLTLIHQLRASDGEWGLASICMGGGNGIALAIRRI